MGVYKIKQYIIVRKDLKMPAGKLAAQAAHASVAALLKASDYHNLEEDNVITADWSGDAADWLKGDFAKVCLEVNSEEELKECYDKALKAGLPCAYIVDNGTTVFNGVKTPTCVGIGPSLSATLEPMFKDLKLYR